MTASTTNRNEALRREYQRRLDNGESIAQLARENGVVRSTMRWRLGKLGVDYSDRAEADSRYGSGSLPKYRVSLFHGTAGVETKLYQIAQEHDIDLSEIRGAEIKLEAVLRVLVTRYSNLKIGKIMGVSETAVRKWAKHFKINTLRRGDWAKVYAGRVTAEELLASHNSN